MNYYELLNLSIEPPCEDEKEIREKIIEARKKWQKETKNPFKEIQARKYLSMVADIEDIMLDNEKRKIHLEIAKKERADKFEILKEELKIVSSKGYVEEEDIDLIYIKYNKEFSKKEIISALKVNIKHKESMDFPDKKVLDELMDLMKKKGLDDTSIYSYIGIKSGESLNNCIRACDRKNESIISKAKKSFEDQYDSQICQIIKFNILSSPNSRNKYNNYLRGNRYEFINNLISTGIKTNTVMTKSLYESIYEVAKSKYNMTQSDFKEYILYNSLYNGYKVISDLKEKSSEIDNLEVQDINLNSDLKNQMENYVLPFANNLSEKIRDIKFLYENINSIYEKRCIEGYHPSEYQVSFLVSISIFFCILDIVVYFLSDSAYSFTLAIPFLINIIIALKSLLDIFLWKGMISSKKKIESFKVNMEELYEIKFLKKICSNLENTTLKKLTNDMNLLNDLAIRYMKEAENLRESFLKNNTLLRVPINGFFYFRDMKIVFLSNLAYISMLLIFSYLLS